MTWNIVSIYYHYIKLPKRSHSHYQDCVNTRHKRYEKYDVGTLFLINSLLSLCEIKFSWIEGKGNRVLFHSLNITIPIILWIFFFLYLLFPIDLRTIQIFTQASAFNLLEIYKTDQSAISLSWNCEVAFSPHLMAKTRDRDRERDSKFSLSRCALRTASDPRC